MSALKGTGVLALWLDVAAELDRETDGWYIDEHLPERVDIGGYRRARRYQALEGAPAYLSLFEADTPDALASAGYLSLVRKLSEQSHRIRAGFSNVARNTFAVRASSGRGLGGIMASMRLKLAGTDRAAALAGMDALVPDLLRRHGVVGVHWLEAAPAVRARMDAERVTGKADAAVDYVLLLEASRVADVRALRDGPLSATALAKSGWADDGFGIYTLLYDVTARENNETMLGDRR